MIEVKVNQVEMLTKMKNVAWKLLGVYRVKFFLAEQDFDREFCGKLNAEQEL